MLVFLFNFLKRMYGRKGNSESWVCGGSASNSGVVLFAALELAIVFLATPFMMYVVLLSYPHHKHQQHQHQHQQNEQENDSNSKIDQKKTDELKEATPPAIVSGNAQPGRLSFRLLCSSSSSTTDSLFSKISISLL